MKTIKSTFCGILKETFKIIVTRIENETRLKFALKFFIFNQTLNFNNRNVHKKIFFSSTRPA